jgi:hypothetical protein
MPRAYHVGFISVFSSRWLWTFVPKRVIPLLEADFGGHPIAGEPLVDALGGTFSYQRLKSIDCRRAASNAPSKLHCWRPFAARGYE